MSPPKSFRVGALAICLLLYAGSLAPQQAAFTVHVPNFVNGTYQQALDRISAMDKANGKATFTAVIPEGPTNGVVTKQDPVAGAPFVPGTKQLVLITKGPSWLGSIIQAIQNTKPSKTKVPYLIGSSASNATQLLHAAHLRASFSNGGTGTVSYQSEPKDAEVPLNTIIDLTMALPLQSPIIDSDTPSATGNQDPKPPDVVIKQVSVPRVVGMTLSGAEERLSSNHLSVGTITRTEEQANTVSAQHPAPADQVDLHSAVDLTLRMDNAPQTVYVPDLFNLSFAEAQTALNNAGLQLGKTTGPETGNVTEQNPRANARVKKNTTVSITLLDPPISASLILLIAAGVVFVVGGGWLVWHVVQHRDAVDSFSLSETNEPQSPVQPAACEFVPRSLTPEIKLVTQHPAIRFRITFHSSNTLPKYVLGTQPPAHLKKANL